MSLMHPGPTILAAVSAALALTQCESPRGDGAHDPLWPDRVPEGRLDFLQHVKPLLEDQCLECHKVKDNRRRASEEGATKKN